MKFPNDFIKQMRLLLGEEDYEEFITSLQVQPPSVSIRLNDFWKPDDVLFQTIALQLMRKVPWCSSGYYMKQRLTFTFDPLLHAGCYYVQEASSMFLEQVIKQYVQQPVIMLDLCAAPGGKSTHTQSLLPEGSLLVANEIVRNRSHILSENITKWGHPDVVVTNNAPEDFAPLDNFFDVILADVPCSGEGMFRKDAKAIDEWSLENVELCHRRQQRIISDIWTCLKPDGILVYSTCTYNTKENEENIAWIQQNFGAETLAVNVPEQWNITGSLKQHTSPVYRFMPHKTEGEGYFLAILRKPSSTSYSSKRNKKRGYLPVSVSKTHSVVSEQWVIASGNYQLLMKGSFVIAFPENYMNELALLEQALRIIQSGTAIAEVKGKDLIPQQALAMSGLLCREAFSTEEVDYKQAIAYLRKETVLLTANSVLGYVLLIYKGVPLGFVKNIGNRVNNLYPHEWCIRSQHLPEEIRIL
ncbi:Ribosomal RNA small subunit methyltransferase F [termite gut metagenome]|uniref:Ribosomal RNA small subunit methyltransferase F n=1 Tax=termite gut metagenome TaxID=433724 RepID=A0A5J4T1W7_9ZZZZ